MDLRKDSGGWNISPHDDCFPTILYPHVAAATNATAFGTLNGPPFQNVYHLDTIVEFRFSYFE